jgi:hypothetical protein
MTISEADNMPAFGEPTESSYEMISPRLGVGYVEYSCGTDDVDVLKRLLPFREEFIKRMKWSTDNSHSAYAPIPELAWLEQPGLEEVRKEADAYDSDQETLHFMISDHETGEIMAGLRLTPVLSVEDSLSWSMFENAPEMRTQAYGHINRTGQNSIDDLNEAAARGDLWDLTRLVTPEPTTKEQAEKLMASIMELFATSYGAQRRFKQNPEDWDGIRWMFTGTDSLVFGLKHLGIQHEVIASGLINEEDAKNNPDGGKSNFCTVKPESAARYLREQAASSDSRIAEEFAFPLEHMNIGFRKAQSL